MINFIVLENRSAALAALPAGTSALYSLETAARLGGVHPELLRYYCQRGLFGDERAASLEPTFDDSSLYELRRAEAWRRYHGVNRRALPLISGLQHKVDRLQAELRFSRRP
jgi:DNA-binding transcriptional MerR regulator